MGRKTNSDEILDDGQPQYDGPSKSALKRAATAAQKLGERLVTLRESELAALPLSERLLDAIRAARNIRSNGGLARQRQYIGKLMREVDPEPLLALLEAGSRGQSLEAERLRRVEVWRDRLIAEGDVALTALGEWRSLNAAQHSQLADALRRARHMASSSEQRTAASRALFRTLRELLASGSHDKLSE